MATLPNSKPKLADERVRLQSLLGSQELERLLKLETIELNRALANFPEVDRLAIKRERRACKRKVDDKTYADKQKATLGQQTQPATQDSLAHHPSTIPGNEAAAGLLRGDGIPTIFAPAMQNPFSQPDFQTQLQAYICQITESAMQAYFYEMLAALPLLGLCEDALPEFIARAQTSLMHNFEHHLRQIAQKEFEKVLFEDPAVANLLSEGFSRTTVVQGSVALPYQPDQPVQGSVALPYQPVLPSPPLMPTTNSPNSNRVCIYPLTSPSV
eukprot:m.188809 g.188809  ORF g.188809 m.188809 type:complete len:270 (-) comp53594_c1_seq97:307-1116(-)